MANVLLSQDSKKAGQSKPNLRGAAAATKTWIYAGQFPDGVSVADYLNLEPAQGAGEAMVSGNLGGPFDVWIFI